MANWRTRHRKHRIVSEDSHNLFLCEMQEVYIHDAPFSLQLADEFRFYLQLPYLTIRYANLGINLGFYDIDETGDILISDRSNDLECWRTLIHELSHYILGKVVPHHGKRFRSQELILIDLWLTWIETLDENYCACVYAHSSIQPGANP